MSKPFDWGVAIWYYNQDGLNSVSEITDWQGNLQEKYTYDEYGSFTIKDAQGNPLNYSPSGNRFYFTGREYDSLTGLYYYRARYYDPSIGRFLQTDPIGYYGGINLYTYVGNNPINWKDSLGLVNGPSLPSVTEASPTSLPSSPYLPSVTEAFPNSTVVAPVVDVAVGGIEAGLAIGFGTASVVGTLVGPEAWEIPIIFGPLSIKLAEDAYKRLKDAIERLQQNNTRCPQ